MTHEKAVEIILKDKGTHFDPTLVEIFLSESAEFKDVSTQFKIQYDENKGV
jgi:response regulator RpfG family c-di-GMP phosphodiesterase